MKKQKSLGQIAYEANTDGGQQNWGPWSKANPLIQRIHERMAAAVARAVRQRGKGK